MPLFMKKKSFSNKKNQKIRLKKYVIKLEG